MESNTFDATICVSMKRILSLITIGIIATTSIAQDQEYAITLKNDTIYGKVIITSYQGSGQQIMIKNGKKKTNLKVYQVKSLSTKKGTYHTLKIRGQYQLAKLEQEGYLSYYKFSGNPSSASLSFDTSILVKRSGEQKEVPNLGFKKHIGKFLSDCENAKNKFEAGEYGRNDLSTVINDYNQCIADRTSKINSKQAQVVKQVNKADQVNSIKEAVNSSSTISDKAEVLEMLSDVQAKLKAGEKIPNYLIGALKEKLATESKLTQQFLDLIQ